MTIKITTPGIVSLTGVPLIYVGKYAIQKTDFGFLWLDTETQDAGYVQVQSKCGVGLPPAATGLYLVGDCNGITDVQADSNYVLARQLSGQGGAATRGCGGARDDGHSRFLFKMGAPFTYIGTDDENKVKVINSTQASDLNGKTWKVTQLDAKTFEWNIVGESVPPAPVPEPAPAPEPPAPPAPVPPPAPAPPPGGILLPKDPTCPPDYPYRGPYGRCYNAAGEAAPTTPEPPAPVPPPTPVPEPPPAELDSIEVAGITFTVEIQDSRLPGVKAEAGQFGGWGYFHFGNVQKPDVLIAVVDGRAVNGHKWVFVSGLTDVGFAVKATEGETGRVYINKQGNLIGLTDQASF